MVEYFQASQQSCIFASFWWHILQTGKKKVAVIPDGTPRAGPPLWPLEIHKGSTSRVKIHAEVPEHCLDPPRLRNCNETRVSNSCLDPTMFISNRFKKLSHIDCYMVYFKLPSHLVFDWQDGFLTKLHRLQGKWRTVNLEILDRYFESKVPLHHMHPVDMDIGSASN